MDPPPPGGDVRAWDHGEVRTWLDRLGLVEYAPLFVRHDINGAVLPDVTRPMLRTIGVERVGDQLRLAAAIQVLRKPPPPPQVPRPDFRALTPVTPNDGAWDDTIEVLDPDLAWVPDPPHPTVPATPSPDMFDPLGTRRSSTPTSIPGSPATAAATPAFDGPATPDTSGSRTSSPLLTRTPAGMSARRLGGSRPPPLHLAQSSVSALPPTWHAAVPPPRTHGRGTAGAPGSGSGSGHLHSDSLPLPGNSSRSHPHNILRVASNASALHLSGNTNSQGSWRHASAAVAGGLSRPGSAPGISLHPAGHSSSSSTHLPLPQVTYHPSPPAQPHSSPTSQLPAGGALHPSASLTGSTPSTSVSALLSDLPHTPTSAPDTGLSALYESPDGPGTASGHFTPRTNRAGSVLGSSYLLRGLTHSASLGMGTPPSTSTPTLEDLQRRTMKFVSADGASRMVTVSDCHDASEVMNRVLRKFGVPLQGNGYALGSPLTATPPGQSSFGGQTWRVAARMPEGQTRLLEADELVAICQGAPVHDRTMGLLLICLNPGPGPLSSANSVAVAPAPSASLDIERSSSATGTRASERPAASMARTASFGDDLAWRSGSTPALPTPTREGTGERHNQANDVTPWEETDDDDETSDTSLLEPALRIELSTPSGSSRRPRGMSKLEAFFGVKPDALELSPAAAQAKLEGVNEDKLPVRAALQRTRRFVGQRPSSELISSHLADYFPATEKKVLQRSARRSMHRSSMYQERALTPPGEREEEAQPPTLPPVPSPGDGWAQKLLAATNGDDDAAAPRLPIASPSEPGDSSLPFHHPFAPTRTASGKPATQKHEAVLKDSPTLYDPLSPSAEGQLPVPPPGPGLRLRRSGESVRSRPHSRRMSILSSHSDTASLMTVDEITLEVESRREAGRDTEFDVSRRSEDRRKSLRSVRSSRSLRPKRRPRSSLHASQRASSTASFAAAETSSMAESAEPEEAPGTPVAVGPDGEGLSTPTAAMIPPLIPRAEQGTVLESSDPVSSAQEDSAEIETDMYESEEEWNDSSDELSDEAGREQMGGKSQIRWIKGALIGAGSFGNVFLGMNQRTGGIMAVKQVELPPGYGAQGEGDTSAAEADIGNHGWASRRIGQLRALEREIELLKSLKHPNIVQYLDSYADETHLNIFLEYVPGGSVAALVSNYGRLNEHLARKFTRQILLGLKFLHSKAIVHRDIKGANILVDTASTIKISDFGISKKVESVVSGAGGAGSKKNRASLQGSVFWMAPEVVKQTSYTSKADIWSLGCLVVEMLTGTHPWASLNQLQALFQIGTGAAHPTIPEAISASAKDFLEKTFEFDHLARPDAATLLEHPWLNPSAALASADKGHAASTPAAPVTPIRVPRTPTGNDTSTPATPAEVGPRIVRKKRPSPAIGSIHPTPS